MRYVNSDIHARVWTHLTNPETGATLELAPGESVDLDEEVADPYLQLVAAPKKGGRVELAPPEQTQPNVKDEEKSE